jgi:hypothetical protein
LFSGNAQSYTLDLGVTPLEVTGFGDTWRNYVAGPYSGQMAIQGYWNAGFMATLVALGAKCVTVIPEGYTLGTPAITMYSGQENFTPGGDSAGVLMAGNLRFVTKDPDGGPLPAVALAHGYITNTTTGTGFDDPTGGAVTQRCAGVLHIFSPTSADSYAIVIQHSTALGSGYTDLVTFTLNGQSQTSEMVKVASGSIFRYRRAVAIRTGSAGETLGYTVSFWHAGF